jgi:hypothetical protein
MGGDKKQLEPNTRSLDKDEKEQLRHGLQKEDVAPVDYESFGKCTAQIIHRAVIGYWRKH